MHIFYTINSSAHTRAIMVVVVEANISKLLSCHIQLDLHTIGGVVYLQFGSLSYCQYAVYLKYSAYTVKYCTSKATSFLSSKSWSEYYIDITIRSRTKKTIVFVALLPVLILSFNGNCSL